VLLITTFKIYAVVVEIFIVSLYFLFKQAHMTSYLCLVVLSYCCGGGGGAGPPGASFGFYLREAFQSQTHTEQILYNESR